MNFSMDRSDVGLQRVRVGEDLCIKIFFFVSDGKPNKLECVFTGKFFKRLAQHFKVSLVACIIKIL